MILREKIIFIGLLVYFFNYQMLFGMKDQEKTLDRLHQEKIFLLNKMTQKTNAEEKGLTKNDDLGHKGEIVCKECGLHKSSYAPHYIKPSDLISRQKLEYFKRIIKKSFCSCKN